MTDGQILEMLSDVSNHFQNLYRAQPKYDTLISARIGELSGELDKLNLRTAELERVVSFRDGRLIIELNLSSLPPCDHTTYSVGVSRLWTIHSAENHFIARFIPITPTSVYAARMEKGEVAEIFMAPHDWANFADPQFCLAPPKELREYLILLHART